MDEYSFEANTHDRKGKHKPVYKKKKRYVAKAQKMCSKVSKFISNIVLDFSDDEYDNHKTIRFGYVIPKKRSTIDVRDHEGIVINTTWNDNDYDDYDDDDDDDDSYDRPLRVTDYETDDDNIKYEKEMMMVFEDWDLLVDENFADIFYIDERGAAMIKRRKHLKEIYKKGVQRKEEQARRMAAQARCKAIKQELIAEVMKPSRIQAMIDSDGFAAFDAY